MNFELHTFALSTASKEKCDAQIILVGASFKPAKDALSVLIAQALKAGDFETKAGKTLLIYRPTGMASGRVVLLGVGVHNAR